MWSAGSRRARRPRSAARCPARRSGADPQCRIGAHELGRALEAVARAARVVDHAERAVLEAQDGDGGPLLAKALTSLTSPASQRALSKSWTDMSTKRLPSRSRAPACGGLGCGERCAGADVAELAGVDASPRLPRIGVEAALEAHLQPAPGPAAAAAARSGALHVDRERLLAERVLARRARLARPSRRGAGWAWRSRPPSTAGSVRASRYEVDQAARARRRAPRPGRHLVHHAERRACGTDVREVARVQQADLTKPDARPLAWHEPTRWACGARRPAHRAERLTDRRADRTLPRHAAGRRRESRRGASH